ncbi:MAG TPA: hypothetical protein VMS65_09885 [Polyangiaceae bacterium]|nr:hypothetical protein [Polyangiaceae bacterium]
MVKRSQPIPVHIHPRRRRSRVTESAAVLADLEVRFARFRAEHARGTTVPPELREAAVAAVRAGVAAGALYRACGISWKQLETWKAGQQSSIRARTRRRRTERADMRVFSVVDEEPTDRARSAEQDLELRFGRWSLRVRLLEPGRGE